MSALRPLGLAVFLISCSGASPTIVTGESLDTAGNQFLATAHLMDQGLKSGAISPAQYKSWVSFGQRFQVSYPLAVDLWRASSKVEDAATNQKVSAIIAGFVSELGVFYADAMQAQSVYLGKVDGGS